MEFWFYTYLMMTRLQESKHVVWFPWIYSVSSVISSLKYPETVAIYYQKNLSFEDYGPLFSAWAPVPRNFFMLGHGPDSLGPAQPIRSPGAKQIRNEWAVHILAIPYNRKQNKFWDNAFRRLFRPRIFWRVKKPSFLIVHYMDSDAANSALSSYEYKKDEGMNPDIFL